MSDSSLDSNRLQIWVDRMRAGDAQAENELLRATFNRLERLARKMLRGFPGVACREQTGDVLQVVALRLLRALQEVRPESTRDFFALAATQMRRVLIDLARHYQGPEGAGAHEVPFPQCPAEEGAGAFDPADARELLERWCAFHEQVETLPTVEREVVSLVFYHDWTQAQIAELFQVSERTIRRYWQSACLKLTTALGETLPET